MFNGEDTNGMTYITMALGFVGLGRKIEIGELNKKGK